MESTFKSVESDRFRAGARKVDGYTLGIGGHCQQDLGTIFAMITAVAVGS